MKTKNIAMVGIIILAGYLIYRSLTGNGFLGGGGGGGSGLPPEIPEDPPPFFEPEPFPVLSQDPGINIQGIMPTKTNYGAVKVYPTVTDHLTKIGVRQIYRSRGGLLSPQAQMQMQLSQKLTPIAQPLPAPMQRQYKSLQDLLKGGG